MKIFNQLVLNDGTQREQPELLKPRSPKLTQNNSQPMVKWFKLFFQIMNDEKMLGKLWKSLKDIVKDEDLSEGLISFNFPERHSR